MKFTDQVGERIKEFRLAAGLTQEKLAGLAGISISFLSMIERGERSGHLQTLWCIAEGLGCDVALLMGPNKVVDGLTPIVALARRLKLTPEQLAKLAKVGEQMYGSGR